MHTLHYFNSSRNSVASCGIRAETFETRTSCKTGPYDSQDYIKTGLYDLQDSIKTGLYDLQDSIKTGLYDLQEDLSIVSKNTSSNRVMRREGK